MSLHTMYMIVLLAIGENKAFGVETFSTTTKENVFPNLIFLQQKLVPNLGAR